MTNKIEDVFNLPPANEQIDEPIKQEETGLDIAQLQQQLDVADKIDAALPMVRDLEQLDADMDKYADKAMHAFQDLMDLGQNVEDRHAGQIFDVASKMMTNAINAKVSKAEKKLKMVELQLRKQRLDHDTGQSDAIEGTGTAMNLDRNALLDAISKTINDK